jgi:hypothetical protein
MSEAFLPNPVMKVTFQENVDTAEASAYVAAFFRPGFSDIPPFFLDDVVRTDGRARSNLGASVQRGEARDEGEVARDLRAPLAVLHGDKEQLVNGRYFDCGAARCRGFPTPGTRRNGKRRRSSTLSSKPSSRRRHKADAQPAELGRSVGPWLTLQWARICRRRSKR